MPAALPPHKARQQLAPAVDRFAMVALATAGHPAFDVSDLELRRPGPSYTVDTVEALRAGGADELFVLVGSETFLDLLSWKDAPRLARLARLVVIPRAGSAFDPDSVQALKVLREIGQERFVRAGHPLPPDGGPRLPSGPPRQPASAGGGEPPDGGARRDPRPPRGARRPRQEGARPRGARRAGRLRCRGLLPPLQRPIDDPRPGDRRRDRGRTQDGGRAPPAHRGRARQR